MSLTSRLVAILIIFSNLREAEEGNSNQPAIIWSCTESLEGVPRVEHVTLIDHCAILLSWNYNPLFPGIRVLKIVLDLVEQLPLPIPDILRTRCSVPPERRTTISLVQVHNTSVSHEA